MLRLTWREPEDRSGPCKRPGSPLDAEARRQKEGEQDGRSSKLGKLPAASWRADGVFEMRRPRSTRVLRLSLWLRELHHHDQQALADGVRLHCQQYGGMEARPQQPSS